VPGSDKEISLYIDGVYIGSATGSTFELPDIERIDRRITGRDRRTYISRIVDEALRDSAVRVSLAAHSGGSVAGFVTAKVDFGDFGRTEPVAVVDTIGVDPGFAGTGIGTALLSQLFINLEALHVERVETEDRRSVFIALGDDIERPGRNIDHRG